MRVNKLVPIVFLFMAQFSSAADGQRSVLKQIAKEDTAKRYRDSRLAPDSRVAAWAEVALKEASDLVSQISDEETAVKLNLSTAQVASILTDAKFQELLSGRIQDIETRDWNEVARDIQKIFLEKNLSLAKIFRVQRDEKEKIDPAAVQAIVKLLIDVLKVEEKAYWETYRAGTKGDPKTEPLPESSPPSGVLSHGLRLLKVLSSFVPVKVEAAEGEQVTLIQYFSQTK